TFQKKDFFGFTGHDFDCLSVIMRPGIKTIFLDVIQKISSHFTRPVEFQTFQKNFFFGFTVQGFQFLSIIIQPGIKTNHLDVI
ncbi:hypothetical protein NL492_26990, partial [Klebsiella pneumoniae]|nr:hypothetical protein [Klebsiella pneumoniae]